MKFFRRRTHAVSRHPLAKRMVIMLVLVGVVLGGIFGFQLFKSMMIKQYFAANRAPPPTVAATTATVEAWQPRVDAIGTLRAVRGVDATTEVSGIVRKIYFESGGDTKAGEPLVQLDADADRAQLRAAEAAAELARTAYNRAKEQYAVQAISQAALESAAAEAKRGRAQVDQYRALLAKKTIRAPFAGRLGISNVSLGQYINPGEKIVTLQSIDPIYIDFALPQQQLSNIAVGQSVTATTNAFPDRTFGGEVDAIDPRIDPATRNFQVRATLGNKRRELLPGMFASATVQVGEKVSELTLPQTAITFNPYGSTVYVLEPTGKRNPKGREIYKAQQRFIETGETRGTEVAVVKGVQHNDLVVTAGQLKLRNGAEAVLGEEAQTSVSPAPNVAGR